MGSLLISITYYYDTLNDDSNIYLSIGRTLDTFILYTQGEKFSVSTYETLKSHLILPTKIKIFLFGEGEHLLGKQFDRILHSDIGYIRTLWSFGLVGFEFFGQEREGCEV